MLYILKKLYLCGVSACGNINTVIVTLFDRVQCGDYLYITT
ncbi:MAG: hypothetical protein RI894_658 [Bacteroidota bacterium]|jgi:hypothetical protein